MADKRDYYEVLGVDKKATEEDIKGGGRQKNIATARHITAYLIRNLTNLPLSGIGDFSRGYIYFMEPVRNINISDNAFFSSAEEDAPNITFTVNNPDPDALKTEGNAY